MVKLFHICKWISFAIYNFSIIEEMASYKLQYCKSESLLDPEINIALLFFGFFPMDSGHNKGATNFLDFL